jgi:hypothetical protein
MNNGEMLARLDRVERALAGINVGLLGDPGGWNTLDVDYEPPRVERLWREFEDGRLYLHRIYPCARALYHPHPWPSAVKILWGSYEMAIGHRVGMPGETPHPPVYAALQVLTKGCAYEMIEPGSWHYVRPLGGLSYSLMVTGPKWDGVWSPKADHKLGPATSESKKHILEAFRSFYGLDRNS